MNASTSLVDPVSGAPKEIQPNYGSAVVVPSSEGAFDQASYGQTIIPGRLLVVSNQSFTLQRAGTLSKAQIYGTQGSCTTQSGATNPDFFGADFDPNMVGSQLKILSGSNIGTYSIVSVIDASHIRLANAALVVDSNIQYSVLPVVPSHSSFFADQTDVPTKLYKQPWRFSSTMIVRGLNLEEQGVSAGDVIESEITRLDTNMVSVVKSQIVSVDRERVGVVFNTDQLIDGVAGRGLTLDDQIQIANDLRVIGVLQTLDGGTFYAQEADSLYRTLTSAAWKRDNFETILTPNSIIDLGLFPISIRPLRIIRNKALPLDPKIVSVPVLQEYLKQPELVQTSEGLAQLSEDTLYPLDHQPFVFVENLDYIIDDESTITGTCNLTQGSDVITIPFGDLVDRSLHEGDNVQVRYGGRVPGLYHP